MQEENKYKFTELDIKLFNQVGNIADEIYVDILSTEDDMLFIEYPKGLNIGCVVDYKDLWRFERFLNEYFFSNQVNDEIQKLKPDCEVFINCIKKFIIEPKKNTFVEFLNEKEQYNSQIGYNINADEAETLRNIAIILYAQYEISEQLYSQYFSNDLQSYLQSFINLEERVRIYSTHTTESSFVFSLEKNLYQPFLNLNLNKLLISYNKDELNIPENIGIDEYKNNLLEKFQRIIQCVELKEKLTLEKGKILE